MLYSEFHGLKLSMLGFGAMRLPLQGAQPNAPVDVAQTEAMVRFAIENGINYFDTAYPYHSGESERVLGNILKNYPRESYYLATKYPGHQIADEYDPADVFEKQLKKCNVEYFDFYLLHNVYENSIHTYTDPRWGIMEYFIEQKRLGRIRHLGFSTHGGLDVMEKFLQLYGSELDFCQIQLNYLDWTLQDARAKCELLAHWNMPVWVMEPVRGGKLANLSQEHTKRLRTFRPNESTAAWAFRWLQSIEGVKVILSGMSNMQQLEDNIATFSQQNPLSPAENACLMDIAETMKDSVPCTACRYCCDGCPAQLDIPKLLAIYNELRIAPNFNASMRVEALPAEKQPGACIGCGACVQACPQKIDIPSAMEDLVQRVNKLPTWVSISKQRAAAQQD